MDFGALPPEINSARMYAGPGAAPLLTASVAWDEVAAELQSAASSYASVIAGLTGGPWLGPAAVAAASAATPYAVWMGATAGQAEQAAGQARAAVAAYETAYAMTVPPAVIAANRTLLMALTATNFFGQNSPAIAITEALYGEMWAQDAAAMYGYAGSSASASALEPFISPPQVANPAGAAGQAAAVAQASGEGAAQHMSLAQLVNSVPGALQELATPTASGTGLDGLAKSASSSPIGSELSAFTTDFTSGGLNTYLMTSMTPIYGLSSVLSMAQTMQSMAQTAAQQVAAEAAEVAAEAAGAAATGAEALGGGVLGTMGQAASLGSLSVPATWTSVIPTAQLSGISSALPNGGVAGNLPPTLLGGLPRGAAGSRLAPGPRYGLVPTVMAQPPSAGYGAAIV